MWRPFSGLGFHIHGQADAARLEVDHGACVACQKLNHVLGPMAESRELAEQKVEPRLDLPLHLVILEAVVRLSWSG